MGLDDLAETAKEDVKGLDDDEAEDLAEQIQLLSQVVITQDKQLEQLQEQIDLLSNHIMQDQTNEIEDDSSWSGFDGSA